MITFIAPTLILIAVSINQPVKKGQELGPEMLSCLNVRVT